MQTPINYSARTVAPPECDRKIFGDPVGHVSLTSFVIPSLQTLVRTIYILTFDEQFQLAARRIYTQIKY